MSKTDHPITPPPELASELVQQWWKEPKNQLTPFYDYIATQAARWGADQELEACCEWLQNAPFGLSLNKGANQLRLARRPKPPSLKAQALGQLDSLHADLKMHGLGTNTDIIRRALELLPND